MPDSNRNNNNRQEAQFFSRIRFYDQTQKLSLGFKYWSGMLCIKIDRFVEAIGGAQGEYQTLQEAYFSPFKAKMFAEDLTALINDPKHHAIGVDLGRGDTKTCVTVAHGKEYDEMYLCDLSPTGEKEKEVTFFFSSTENNYVIDYKDYVKMDWSKIDHVGIELQMIRDILEQYYKGQLGGYSYGVMDYSRFHNTRVDGNLNKIMEKLGVETGRREYTGGGANSYFRNGAAQSTSNSGDVTSTHRDIDELDDLLDD